MGRVKRYRKIKACDPFAKRQTKEVDTVHDQAPDLHEARGSKHLANYRIYIYSEAEEEKAL